MQIDTDDGKFNWSVNDVTRVYALVTFDQNWLVGLKNE